MLEIERRKLQRLAAAREIVPGDGIAEGRCRGEIRRKRHHDRRRDAVDGRNDALHGRPRIAGFAVVVVAVDGEQDLRPDLPETVHDAVDAEIR